jgi:hypothetical protein
MVCLSYSQGNQGIYGIQDETPMTPVGMEACVKQVRRPDTMLDECEKLNCRSSPLLSVTLEDLRHVKSSLNSAHPYQVTLAEQTFPHGL